MLYIRVIIIVYTYGLVLIYILIVMHTRVIVIVYALIFYIQIIPYIHVVTAIVDTYRFGWPRGFVKALRS
jgi:cellulose synthase/poly-beta-1,6-N-acetylglucosamine synthase-like glycosyltransferase